MLSSAQETAQLNPDEYHQSRLVTGVQLLFLALLPVLAYHSTLNNYFLNTDFSQIHYANVALAKPQLFIREFTSSWLGASDYELFYRPLPLFLLAFNLLTSGVSPFGYHLTSLALHVGTVWCVYFFVLELLRWLKGRNGQEPSDIYTAVLCAALFSVFPVEAEAIIWLGGRPDCAAGLFYILTLIFWLRERRTGCMLPAIASLVAYAVALLFKEVAVSLIVLLPLLCLLKSASWKERLLSIVPSCWKLWTVFCVYLAVRWAALGTIGGGYRGAFWHLLSLDDSLAQWASLERLRMLLVPLNPDLSFAFPMPVLLALLYAAMAVISFSDAKELRARCGLLALCIFWFAASLTPELKTAALTHSFASGRSFYIACLPLCLLISLLLMQPFSPSLPRNKLRSMVSIICGAGFVVSFFICDLVNNQAWNNASQITRSLQLQLARLIADTPEELKVAVLNPPLNIGGPYGLNQALLPVTQNEPFLPKSNYHRVQMLDREHFTERDANLINATALRQYLLCFCVLSKWNSQARKLTRVQLIPDMMPLVSHNLILTEVADDSTSAVYEILIDPSLIPLSCEALEVSFSCEGTRKGGYATLSWRDNWKQSALDVYETDAYTDVVGDAKLHKYRFPLAEQVGWYLQPSIDRLHLRIQNVKAIKNLTVRLASDADYVPRLRADNRYLRQSPTGLIPRGNQAVFICDTEVDGARGLVIELSKPNQCFETYTRTYRDTETSAQALKRWTADQTSSTFRIPTSDLEAGTYSVRAASLNGDRLIVGAFSDPVVFQVSQNTR
jgi:hypothetical protein